MVRKDLEPQRRFESAPGSLVPGAKEEGLMERYGQVLEACGLGLREEEERVVVFPTGEGRGSLRAELDLEEAEKNIPTTKKAVEQAEENLRVSRERYRAQVTTSTEVLDAQTLLSQARTNYHNALYDHNLAKAGLMRAVGEY